MPPSAPTAPIRLIVVDDDAGIRTLLEVSVTLDSRFELVGSASTGTEALGMLSGSSTADVDVVLLDVTLPDRDGIDLVPEVRATYPNACVALFTGWSDEATLQRATAAGADGVFPKDGEPRRLLDGLAALRC